MTLSPPPPPLFQSIAILNTQQEYQYNLTINNNLNRQQNESLTMPTVSIENNKTFKKSKKCKSNNVNDTSTIHQNQHITSLPFNDQQTAANSFIFNSVSDSQHITSNLG